MLEIERARSTGWADAPERPWFCTKEAATPVLQLPAPPGGNRYPRKAAGDRFKWPSLEEAHRHFFGVGLDRAHDAMVDAEACARIYFALQNGAPAAPAPVAPKSTTPPPARPR